MFDPEIWRKVPFQFWTLTAFVFGSIVGSFLNVCIHRLPLGQSIVHPPSHCPHCRYSIPWYLNIPLVTWVWLGGRCAHCQAPISPRYFLVELLTGVMGALCWINFGHISPFLAAAYFIFIAGLIVGSFIDIEHLIIPDQITFGGMAAGLLLSLLVPQMHVAFPGPGRLSKPGAGIAASIAGLAIGAGVIYAALRAGKYFLGRQKVELPPSTRIIFTESGVQLPDEEIPFETLFYRKTDAIELQARQVELIDRCYANVPVRLTPDCLKVGEDSFEPEKVLCLEVVADRIVLPREAMGPADVTFMGAIGAFLGWPAIFFSLAAGCFIGSIAGLTPILLKKKHLSAPIPFGPYLALGALIWVFGGYHWMPFYGAGWNGGRQP
jgi:leader peptidase (prepilin peptidase)/N-methyltransferase